MFGLCSKCLGKELPPLSMLYVNEKNFCGARKGLGTSLALQCYVGLVDSGCRVRNDKSRLR